MNTRTQSQERQRAQLSVAIEISFRRLETMNIYANFNNNTDSKIAKPVLSFSNLTPPRGIPICESEHYTAFELANEESECGFEAVVHAKRSGGRHTENVTRYCFVRSMVASQLETLETYRKGR